MNPYIPHTETARAEMLRTIGVSSPEDLFASIPPELRAADLKLPPGLSEMEVSHSLRKLAAQNKIFPVIFRGAGAYRHYIPAAVKRITANETFVTAYTPYQAELSQGVLQAFFEYQTMICRLTGMAVSNASVYDGAGAAAEAVNMCRDRNRNGVLVAETAHPQAIQTIETYCWGYGIPVTRIPAGEDGRISAAAVEKELAANNTAASVYVQSPNFYGLIEDVEKTAEAAHKAGALLVCGTNPASLGIYESPGALGADIVCGEGQPLGIPLSYGGPYLGFMACTAALMRKLPGRIVGETTDAKGERAFVLTLQAREQHIRREKASSNICSNEAHCALTAAVYLAALGEEGFYEMSRQCHSKAVYAAQKIAAVPGFSLVHAGEFFNEFVTACPDSEKFLKILEEREILGGLPLGKNKILWCVTEVNTKEEIDTLADILRTHADETDF